MYVRCHVTDEIPGKYNEAFALEEMEPGVWEAKIAKESLTASQRRDFEESALATGEIEKVVWRRHINGVVKFRETGAFRRAILV